MSPSIRNLIHLRNKCESRCTLSIEPLVHLGDLNRIANRPNANKNGNSPTPLDPLLHILPHFLLFFEQKKFSRCIAR